MPRRRQTCAAGGTERSLGYFSVVGYGVLRPLSFTAWVGKPRKRFGGHSSVMATLRSSGLLQGNAPNRIRGPWTSRCGHPEPRSTSTSTRWRELSTFSPGMVSVLRGVEDQVKPPLMTMTREFQPGHAPGSLTQRKPTPTVHLD